MKYIIGIVVVVIIVVAVFLIVPKHRAKAPTNGVPQSVSTSTATGAASTGAQSAQAPGMVEVAYTSQGFVPQNVTIKKGDMVMWKDETSYPFWIASGVHPTHTGYDGTTEAEHCAPGYAGPAPFDECGSGSSFSFTFLKTGTWSYHDHLSAGDTGTVTVTP